MPFRFSPPPLRIPGHATGVHEFLGGGGGGQNIPTICGPCVARRMASGARGSGAMLPRENSENRVVFLYFSAF